MFGKYSVFMVIFFLLGCADPRYVRASESELDPAKEKVAATCLARFRVSSQCVTWSWEKKPTETDEGSFTFRIYEEAAFDQFPVLVDSEVIPHVLLWMPSMGHGSSPVRVSKIGPGLYRASRVFFVMPGNWEIRFQLKNGNAVQDEAIVEVVF